VGGWVEAHEHVRTDTQKLHLQPLEPRTTESVCEWARCQARKCVRKHANAHGQASAARHLAAAHQHKAGWVLMARVLWQRTVEKMLENVVWGVTGRAHQNVRGGQRCDVAKRARR
jgi:hypothetical protein